MVKFMRRWKKARYNRAVATIQAWIRRRLFWARLRLKVRTWRQHTERVSAIICRVQRRWRFRVLTRGRPASASLDHRVCAAVVMKSLLNIHGQAGVQHLYMSIALDAKRQMRPSFVNGQRVSSHDATAIQDRFVRQLQALTRAHSKQVSRDRQKRHQLSSISGKFKQEPGNVARKPFAECGSSGQDQNWSLMHANQHVTHKHLLGDDGLMTFALGTLEKESINHMGLPGRRGCGKGNTVHGLKGGGPWRFTIEPALAPGMQINPSNGAISGVPKEQVQSGPVVHTITAENQVGKTTCQITIAIEVMPQPPGIPEFKLPARSRIKHNPDEIALRERRRTQHVEAISSGDGGMSVLNASMKQLFDMERDRFSESWVIPVGKYAMNPCNISGSKPMKVYVTPDLPEGLDMDPDTGCISGWPLQACRGSYSISAFNDAGDSLGAIYIDVQIPPSALIYWQPSTPEGGGGTGVYDLQNATSSSRIILGVGIEMEEMRLHTRRRQQALRQKWQQRRARREIVQLRWPYLCRPLYYFLAKSFPLAGSSPTFMVTPDLPEGLILDPHTGSISGTPLAVKAETIYRVTSLNAAGRSSVDICFEVQEPPSVPRYKGTPLQLQTLPSTYSKFERGATVCVRVGYLRGEDVNIKAPDVTGTGPLHWSVLPALPVGLALNSDTGSIRGSVKNVVPLVHQNFTVRCKNSAGRSFASIQMMPESLVAGRVVDVTPVDIVKGAWKPQGFAAQSVLLVRLRPPTSQEPAAQAARHSQDGDGDAETIEWQGNDFRTATPFSNSAFSPAPPRGVRPVSASYRSNASSPAVSTAVAPRGVRPVSASYPSNASPSAVSTAAEQDWTRSKSSTCATAGVEADSDGEDGDLHDGVVNAEEGVEHGYRCMQLLTCTDSDGYFSCRGIPGLYALAVLPCRAPHEPGAVSESKQSRLTPTSARTTSPVPAPTVTSETSSEALAAMPDGEAKAIAFLEAARAQRGRKQVKRSLSADAGAGQAEEDGKAREGADGSGSLVLRSRSEGERVAVRDGGHGDQPKDTSEDVSLPLGVRHRRMQRTQSGNSLPTPQHWRVPSDSSTSSPPESPRHPPLLRHKGLRHAMSQVFTAVQLSKFDDASASSRIDPIHKAESGDASGTSEATDADLHEPFLAMLGIPQTCSFERVHDVKGTSPPHCSVACLCAVLFP